MELLNIKRYLYGKNSVIYVFVLFVMLFSCRSKDMVYDATGTFESDEIIISSEVTGKIIKCTIREGDQIAQGKEAFVIDGTNLSLQKDQAEASLDALDMKLNNAGPQIVILSQQLKVAESQLGALEQQLIVLKKEQQRISSMFASEAATSQQMDDINGKVDILQKQILSAENQKAVIRAQIKSAKDQVDIQNRGVSSERLPMEKKIAILDDQLKRSTVLSPKTGTVLTKYANEGEIVMAGKPLYKLADLSIMTLRAYISGSQLPSVKLGQVLDVYTDDGNGAFKPYKGTVRWIADKAEFTPKTIQTKDERANLVYAVKIEVKNDGFIKIGMYGEVSLNQPETAK